MQPLSRKNLSMFWEILLLLPAVKKKKIHHASSIFVKVTVNNSQGRLGDANATKKEFFIYESVFFVLSP